MVQYLATYVDVVMNYNPAIFPEDNASGGTFCDKDEDKFPVKFAKKSFGVKVDQRREGILKAKEAVTLQSCTYLNLWVYVPTETILKGTVPSLRFRVADNSGSTYNVYVNVDWTEWKLVTIPLSEFKISMVSHYLPRQWLLSFATIVDFFSNDGLIFQVLQKFGMPDINYLGSEKYLRSIYVTTNIWQNIGWNSIIYLSALAMVDVELYEAADIISSYVYRMGIGGARYSYLAAVSIFQSVMNIVFLYMANTISKKYNEATLF